MPSVRVLIPDADVVLRPASAEDEPFLRQLHGDRRAAELAPLGWPEDILQSFLDLQFRAQLQGYGDAYPTAESSIVLEGPRPVGRLLLQRATDHHLVVDVAILDRCRGRGIGTALLRQVLADAADAGVPVRLRTAASQPRLLAWYARLGFRIVERGDLDVSMVAGNDVG